MPRRRLNSAALVVLPFVVLALAGAALLLVRDAKHSSAAEAIDDAVSAEPSPERSGLEAPTGFEPYIFRPSGERADPVNLIFLHTDAATVAKAMERVLGWRPVSASNMSFRRGERQRPTSRQLAVDISPGSRYHVRVQAVPLTDTQIYVLASVHRDDTVACGHVGRAFDQTRDIVGRAFAEAGFPTRVIELSNDSSGAHCDGSHVPGDGRAVLIDLSRMPRAESTHYRAIGAE